VADVTNTRWSETMGDELLPDGSFTFHRMFR
jgi:hypothetical protein